MTSSQGFVCRVCSARASTFLSFGPMPLANGFLSAADFHGEFRFELSVGFCPACCMVQLGEQPRRDQMFGPNYPYYSSTSSSMSEHFARFAATILDELPTSERSLIVELGSNDGIMLRHLTRPGVTAVGIDPSTSVAQRARDQGLNIVVSFFDADVAARIAEEYGSADVIVGANVMCHIADPHEVLRGVRRLLKPGAVFVFEDPYLGDVVHRVSYDQIYDEHVFLFAATSIANLARLHDMELVDVAPQSVHGGSMRFTLARLGERQVSDRVGLLLQQERVGGLCNFETFEELRRSIEKSRDDLRALLGGLRAKGKRIVGYGATSKSTTVTNYCGITPDLVEYLSDTTPAKQGKFSPGAHIPVRPYREFVTRYPDYALLFAWNHATEILTKETEFRKSGGRWIVYVPSVALLADL